MSEAVGFDLSRQQRHGLYPGVAGAVLTHVADLPAPISADLVRTRIQHATDRHEALRSTLRRVAGLTVPLQFVHEHLPIAWLGLAAHPDIDAIARAQQAALDLEQGPVVAAALIGGVDGIGGAVIVLSAFAAIADLPTLELLAAAVAGDEPAVADPVQYAEYAAWQQERSADSSSPDAQNAVTAWQRLNAGGAATLLSDLRDDLPGDVTDGPATDGPANPANPANPAIAAVSVATDAAFDVESWLAAWALTLARLTGGDCVTLGVELDPRNDPELAGAAGPYTTIVPFSVMIPASGSFASFVDQVRRDRDLALTWLEWAPEQSGALVFSVGALDARVPRGAFQLELRVVPDGSAAQIVVGMDATAQMAERAARGLSAVLASSAGAVSDADVLDDAQVASLLGAAPVAVSSTPIINRVLARAEQHPDRIALTDGVRRLTYGQLAEQVNGLAAALVDAGAGPNAPVATYLDRSVDLIVAMLAAQRARAGYLPLDVHQPAVRSLRQVQAAGTTVLVSDGSSLEGFSGQVVPVGRTGSSAPSMPTPDDLSYVIFTSGSTGTPKGVEVCERSLANYVEAILELVAAVDGDGGGETARPLGWALLTSPTTDLGNTAIFPALASGGTLHVVATETTQDPGAFSRYVREHAVDVLKITPSHLGALLADDEADVLPRKVLFVGGEALSWQLVEQVAARGSCRIVNHYGPTETTVGALVNVVDPAAKRDGLSVPIGRPLAGSEALVLDARRRLAPPGAIGELAIGGAGVARGYREDDGRTVERFIAHPYRAGQRVYLTGDLARRDSDGAVSFLGRRDGQVKIRGFRIERGEIESALLDHPGVQRAAVVVRTDVGPDPQLIAYVVSQVNPNPTEQDLHRQLAERLPGYLIPSRIVQLDTLPLRSNGKLDEAALPAPLAPVTPERARPVGATEESIAAIFATVLGVDEVGATEDFFALGGHSLLATRIIVGIRSTLGVQLPVYAVFEAPTVRGLADLVLAAVSGESDVPDDELARMIAELSELTDEEAAALLTLEGDDGGTDIGVTEQR